MISSPPDAFHDASKPTRTPLPIRHILILMFLRFCESASSFVVYPFLNELLTSVTGADSSRVGYYAGTMESARQLMHVASVMYWCRLSDRIGRKPVLLIGMAALVVSMSSFGLSKTFLALVVSRCIFTALNSNAGVIKSAIGEITDSTNRADAFALLQVPWAAGSSFGALVGGSFSRPADHFPSLFGSKFWVDHPYFLPCAMMACLALLACWLIIACLRESAHITRFPPKTTNDPATAPLLPSTSDTLPLSPPDAPVPFMDLIRNSAVLLPVACYVTIAFLQAAYNVLQPLFLAMPVVDGGLGLPPRTIGFVLATFGLANTAVQTLLLARAVRWLGAQRVLVCAMGAFMGIFAFMPVLNMVARAHAAESAGDGDITMPVLGWCLLACQLGCSLVMELGYGCVFIFITAAAPNKRSLGATNGLAQTLVPVSRIAAPALASSLLAASIQYNLLGGYAVYAVFVVLAAGAMRLASCLPQRLD